MNRTFFFLIHSQIASSNNTSCLVRVHKRTHARNIDHVRSCFCTLQSWDNVFLLFFPAARSGTGKKKSHIKNTLNRPYLRGAKNGSARGTRGPHGHMYIKYRLYYFGLNVYSVLAMGSHGIQSLARNRTADTVRTETWEIIPEVAKVHGAVPTPYKQCISLFRNRYHIISFIQIQHVAARWAFVSIDNTEYETIFI